MAISARIRTMMTESSWIRRMFETGARLKAEHGADSVCDFSLGNPNVPPPGEFAAALKRAAADETAGVHGYMPNGGYPWVRERVAGFVSSDQGVPLTADQLIMTCGAGGALNVALKTILDPGDKVLSCTPCFMEYRFYVDNHGGRLELVPGKHDLDLDVEALADAVDTDTAAVIINSPNNPSGRVYPESTLRALGEALTRKSHEIGRTVYLISDEPYRRIVYDGVTVPSVFAAYKHSIIATSYSKLSIPGERIGWLAVHPQADEAADLMNGFILCNRILGYVNAPALMQRVVADLQGEGVDPEVYKRKRDLLCEGLARIGYDFVKPEGTFYLFPKAPGGDDLKAVAAMQDELILTVPGRGFGSPGYFRIAFCVDDQVIQRSMPGFARAFERINTPPR